MSLSTCIKVTKYIITSKLIKVELSTYNIKNSVKMSGKVTNLIKCNEFTYSLEISSAEKHVLSYDKIDSLAIQPVFIAITWHAKLQDMNSLESVPLKLATHLRNKGKNVVMHLCCDQMKADYLKKLLIFLKEKGVCNLLVMRGENYDVNGSEFRNSKELLSYIRNLDNERYFCVGVVGFPDQPGDDKIKQLKDKIDSGADFIITQAFVEFKAYNEYVRKCKNNGITVPIIPGIFIYENYQHLLHIHNVCKIKINSAFLENFKNNKNVSVAELVKEVAKDIKSSGAGYNHIHFYTLNNFKEAETLIKDIIQNI